MVATARRPVTVAVLGMLIALSLTSATCAQAPPLPPAPALPAPTDEPAPPALGRPQPLPGAVVPAYPLPPGAAVNPPPPNPIVYPPAPLSPPPPPLYQPHDPGPNGWGPYSGPSPDTSLLFNVELQILRPALKNRLTNTVALPDGTEVIVAPPGANLSTTVSPEFEIGYRLSESLGQFTIGYRFLASSGTAQLNDGLHSTVKTRLNVNVLDFDYSTARYTPIPRWDMKWWLGVRYATNFFDNRQTNDFMDIHDSNYFNGAGPHAALEVQRHIGPLPAFAIFAKTDVAVLIGPLRQRFSESLLDPGGASVMGETDQRKTQSVPTLNVRAGISYSPPRMENLRFSAGYQFEDWWYLGQLGNSRGELSSHGGFLRAELDF
jgi:hypothetical protein